MTRTTSIQQTVADAQLYLLLQPPVSPRRLSQASTTSAAVADNDASSSVASNNDIGDDIGDDIGALSDFAPTDDIMTTSATTSATTSTSTTTTARLTRAGTMTQTIADAAQFLALPCAPTTDTATLTADCAVMTRGRERRMRDCPARNLRSRSKQQHQ